MSKPSLFPSPSFRWPDHSPYCPGRPDYKGVCDCGAERPPSMVAVPVEGLKKLQRDRDELITALEDVRARLHGANERADALIARIKSS